MQSAQRRSKKVKVWVRTRPTANFAHENIDLQSDGKTVDIHCTRDPRKGAVNNQVVDWSFRVDGVLHNASQETVYNTTSAKLLNAALNGYNGTVMCYGQTGAGKTFTMTGATENYQHRGILPRSLAQLYRLIDDRTDSAVNIRISYLEIYNETMFDLLSTLPESLSAVQQGSALQVVEDETGVNVKGLSSHPAHTEEEALNLLFEGETNRAIAEHTLNKQSSRSHCIFTVYIETRSRVHSESTYTISKLNFVDLAGSERLSKTRSAGRTQQEAMYINKSLSFLEQTVMALGGRPVGEFVPFRHTKLTHCLKDSIGGNCNTVLIANVWGEAEQLEETISTLRFASRMMCVSSEATVNERVDPEIKLKKLEQEIAALKNELSMHDTLNNRSQITYDPLSEQLRYDLKSQVQRYLEGTLDQLEIVNLRQIQGIFEAFKELHGQQERVVEERLRARYTLIDRSDAAAISAAQQAGVPIKDDGELVGETDGQGFGVGPADSGTKIAPSSVAQARRREARRNKSKDKERTSPTHKTSRPVSGQKPVQESQSQQKEVGKESAAETHEEQLGTPGESTAAPEPTRPHTPPPKHEEFENFKKEAGSEINRILTENKEILGSKKKAYADLARQINTTKQQIDESKEKLDQLRDSREAQDIEYNEDGDLIISEEEYLEIKRLKDLKAVYRNDFDELRNLKSEVQYCQKLVDQCRQRLVQEFETWYSESYLTHERERDAAKPTTEQQSKATVVSEGAANEDTQQQPSAHPSTTVVEDAQEQFDRLQMALLLEDPDSAPFYNAKIRTQRRKIYESAIRQAPASSRGKPGTPTRTIRQVPPKTMTVHVQ